MSKKSSTKKRKQTEKASVDDPYYCTKCGESYSHAVPDWVCNVCVQGSGVCHNCSPPSHICQRCKYPLCENHTVFNQQLAFCFPVNGIHGCLHTGPKISASTEAESEKRLVENLKVYVNSPIASDEQKQKLVWALCKDAVVNAQTAISIGRFDFCASRPESDIEAAEDVEIQL